MTVSRSLPTSVLDVWSQRTATEAWAKANAVFDPSGDEDEGRWRFNGRTEETWPLAWGAVRFKGRFTAFRHLAFFPEQAANWTWLQGRNASAPRPLRILNLFGYTGVASLVCAAAGAQVTHVDASKKSVGWARENAALSGLEAAPSPLRPRKLQLAAMSDECKALQGGRFGGHGPVTQL